MRKECPSLSATPSGDISLRIRFDGDTTASVKDVLFRVLPEAWPAAISDVLPLVHVDAKIKVESGPERGKVGEKEKTWEDLQREQAPLGVQGWTDRVKAGQEESTAHGWLY